MPDDCGLFDPEDPDKTTESYWYRIPEGEIPDFGDLPDAGKRLDDRGKERWAAWQREKEALAKGFDRINKPERALALRNCCTCLVVHRYENGRVVRSPAECRDLVCTTGIRSRSRRLLASTTAAIESFLDKNPGQQGLMVTLSGGKTVPSHDLQKQVGKVIRAFGELMQRARIKRAVKGWVRVVELTRNPQTREWNVHLHAIWFVTSSEYFRRNSPFS